MPKTEVNHSVPAVDPDQILSLELISGKEQQIELRIFVADRDKPVSVRFGDMKSAIRCYEDLWVARKLGQRHSVEIR